ncbi:MAG TPA: STAS domain-containing protein, partial [Pirellulales bacterium]|nr:STAS domain-containing protein [Pirellulales bacterium]
ATLMLGLSSGWALEVERGPDWLFVRPIAPPEGEGDGCSLAESVWSVVKQHFVYRVVLECGHWERLSSGFVAQLVGLQRRLQKKEGTLRLCGLSDENQQVLKSCQLDGVFPQFRNRSQAVLAHRPVQPR